MILVLLWVILSVLSGAVGRADAISFQGISLRPIEKINSKQRSATAFHYHLQPGQMYNDRVEIANTSDQLKRVSLNIVDAQISPQNDFSCKSQIDTMLLPSLIHLRKSVFDIAPHARQTVDFTIKLPIAIDQDELQGCITATELMQDNTASGIQLKTQVANRIAIDTDTKDYSVTVNRIQSDCTMLRCMFSTTIQNTGRISFLFSQSTPTASTTLVLPQATIVTRNQFRTPWLTGVNHSREAFFVSPVDNSDFKKTLFYDISYFTIGLAAILFFMIGSLVGLVTVAMIWAKDTAK